ncbi:hypothetical protein B0H19DRAFT_1272776 [Mycena capillaripes]|nr:hypothetical protein B0H19DRAFT_1272776 [Mycena capillaripes]
MRHNYQRQLLLWGHMSDQMHCEMSHRVPPALTARHGYAAVFHRLRRPCHLARRRDPTPERPRLRGFPTYAHHRQHSQHLRWPFPIFPSRTPVSPPPCFQPALLASRSSQKNFGPMFQASTPPLAGSIPVFLRFKLG